MPLANPYQRYQQTSVKTADAGDLLVLTYEAILRWLGRADEAIDTGKVAAAHEALVNTQELVRNLASALDFERGGAIAENLSSLYEYLLQQLLWANVNKDKDAIAQIRELVLPLLDAWRVAVPKARQEGQLV